MSSFSNKGVATIFCNGEDLLLEVGGVSMKGHGFVHSLNQTESGWGQHTIDVSIVVYDTETLDRNVNMAEVLTKAFSEFDLMKEINRRWKTTK